MRPTRHFWERASRTLCLVGLTLAAIGHQAFVVVLHVLAWRDGASDALYIIPSLLSEGTMFCIVYLLHIVVFASALWWDAVDSGTVGSGWQGASRHSRGTRWAHWGSWIQLQCLLAANAIYQLSRLPDVGRSFVGRWSTSHQDRQAAQFEGFGISISSSQASASPCT